VRTVLLGYRSFLRHRLRCDPAPCDAQPHRPSRPIRFGRWAHCPPRQRYEQCATGWPALLRPGLRRCAEHELRCFRPTSASQPFSTTSTRASLRSQHLFEACASPLRPGLPTRMTETGGPGVSRRPIRFGGRPRVGARRSSSVHSRCHRTSDTPVAARPCRPARRGTTEAGLAETVLNERS